MNKKWKMEQNMALNMASYHNSVCSNIISKLIVIDIMI